MDTTNTTYRFINTTTFVMGNRKNAGKTTFMNWALNQIREVESPAFATIGIDGERHDLIDGRTKPMIHTQEGDAIVTSYPMLKKSNGQFRIEKAFTIKTPLGQLVVATTLRSGNIELVGPEHNQQLQQVSDFLIKELNYRSILIDGAASRLTPVNAIANSGFYYVLNIDRRNLKKALEQMQLLSFVANLDTVKADDDAFFLEGALTAGKINHLPMDGRCLVIKDLTSVFLSYEQMKKLNNQMRLKVKNALNLKGFVSILKDIQQADFERALQNKGITTPMIYNPYVHQ